MAEKINIEEHGQVPASIVPTNLNERAFIPFGIHTKGGHDYPYLKATASDPTKWDDVGKVPVTDPQGEPVDPTYLPPYRTQPGLLDMHPNRMVENMSASVKIGFERVEVTLIRNPSFINYGEITEENWNQYWHIKNRFIPENAQIIEFAEEYDGTIAGYPDEGRPPYDSSTGTYPAEAESLWESVQDTKIHRWYRIKFVDFDENDDPIVGKISPPIPIGENSTTFVREVNYYIRSGDKATETATEARPARPPAFLTDGSPNNSPAGYTDEPIATDTDKYLWVIRGLRKLTGDIDTIVGWSIPALVPEDANLTRYSTSGKPDPNTIVATTQTIDASLEQDLQDAGWVTALEYDKLIHYYIATRIDNGDTTYSKWKVEQIRQEDGTILKRRFKLFPLISDYDDPTWITNNKPSGWDPADQGWLENLGQETPFLINLYSEATFYPDQTIKSNWSDPRPFTSVNTYSDDISIHPDDGGSIDATKQIDDTIIKRFVGGVETHDPENLWLRANLLKGDNDLATDGDYTLTYQWYKIYDDGEFLVTPTDLGTNRDILINHASVTGRAIFKCELTLDGDEVQAAIADGSISSLPVFVEQISITDQVDGRDGRTLSISSTQSRFIKTGASAPFTYLPSSIIIRAEGDNVDISNVKWYYLNGSDPINDTWVEITATTNTLGSSPKHTYKDSANNLVLVGGVDTTATNIFEVLSQEEAIFKAEIPASGSLPKLEDWTMISRITQNDLAAGESAYDVHVEGLFHQIRIDETGTPLAGEYAAIESFIEARKGNTLLANGDYSVSVASVSGALSVTGDVVIANEGANQKKITFVASPTWDITKRDALITLNVTYGTETKTQYIGLGTSFEPSGFTGLNISSDRSTFTFDYSDGGRDDIVLTALLTKHTDEGNTELNGWSYEWKVKSGRFQSVGVGGIITGADVTGNQLTVSPGDLDGSAEYECYAYQSKSGSDYVAPFYVDSVRINDQPDNTIRRAYHANSHDTPPSIAGLSWTAISGGSDYNGWGKDYVVTDKWSALSYDGGTTWEGPFKINPQDGVPGNDGSDGADGVDGEDGASGGLYSWKGSFIIPINTNINGASAFNIGKIQNENLYGAWIMIKHNDLEGDCHTGFGISRSNYIDLGTFNGNDTLTQWRVFWVPGANISETSDNYVYLWSTTGDAGSIYEIIVQAAPNSLRGPTGPTGLTGSQGVAGPPGPAGESIKSYQILDGNPTYSWANFARLEVPSNYDNIQMTMLIQGRNQKGGILMVSIRKSTGGSIDIIQLKFFCPEIPDIKIYYVISGTTLNLYVKSSSNWHSVWTALIQGSDSGGSYSIYTDNVVSTPGGVSQVSEVIPFKTSDYWDGNELLISGSNGIPFYESWAFKFKKNTFGVVYYYVRYFRGSGGDSWKAIYLGGASFDKFIPDTMGAAGFSNSTDRVQISGNYYYPVLNLPMSGSIIEGGALPDHQSVGVCAIARRSGTTNYYMLVRFDDNRGYMGAGSYFV